MSDHPSARCLVVMRHSRAEPFADSDYERELTERGAADARQAGEWLASSGVVPDLALVSSAVRTRQTWAAVAGAWGAEAVAAVVESFSDDVYSGGPDIVLQCLQEVPEDVRTVVYIGHNPTAAHVAYLVDDGGGEPGAMAEMLHGFPTSAAAVFDVEAPWSDLDEGRGRVTHFYPGH